MLTRPTDAPLERRPGLWVTCLGPSALEALAGAGLGWVGLDLQHGSLEVADVPALLRVCEAADLRCLVRVPSHDPAVIGRVLDHGAQGVIVPGVETVAQATAVAAAAAAPPLGTRSTGLGRAAVLGAIPPAPVVLVMVETAAGLAEHARMLEAPGVHGVFVGPYDLALSMGASGVRDLEVVQAVRRVVEATAEAGLLTGYFAGDPDLVGLLPPVDLLAVDSDVAVLRAGVSTLVGRPS